MSAITGTVKNGQIVLDQPADWPEGSRVVVEPLPGGRPDEVESIGGDLTGNVLTFCNEQGLTAHVRTALALVRQSFPSLQDLAVRVDDDPEEEGEWLVIEITAREEVQRFLDAYNRCAELWVAQLPPEALGKIRLSYSLS